jgi:hypothetical protein
MVEEARTEFVARMDGDDVCLPDLCQIFEMLFKIKSCSSQSGSVVASEQKYWQLGRRLARS